MAHGCCLIFKIVVYAYFDMFVIVTAMLVGTLMFFIFTIKNMFLLSSAMLWLRSFAVLPPAASSSTTTTTIIIHICIFAIVIITGLLPLLPLLLSPLLLFLQLH